MLILKIERRIGKEEFWDIFNKWLIDIPRIKKKVVRTKLTPEQLKENRRKHYQKNKERLKEQARLYHEQNRDKRLKQMLEYKKKR